MTALSTFSPWIKQPSENRVYAVDFANLLASGDNLSTVTSITTNQVGSGLTIGSGSVDGTTVEFRLSGGTSGILHHLTIVVTTSMGDTIEGDVFLKVINL